MMQCRTWAKLTMLLLMFAISLALLATTTKIQHHVDRLEPIAFQEVETRAVERRAAFCDGQAPGAFGAVWRPGDYFRDAWCVLATWWRGREQLR